MEEKDIMSKEEKKTNTKAKKTVLVLSLSIAAVFLLCIISLSIWVLSYDNVFPGVTVCGAELENLSINDARKKVEKEVIKKALEKEIDIQLEDKSIKLMSSDMDINLDVDKTLEKVFDYGKKGNFFQRIYRFVSGRFKNKEIPPVATINEEKFEAYIKELVGDKEIKTKETSYKVEDDYLIIERGHNGKVLDRKIAKDEIIKNALSKEENKIVLSFVKEEYKKINEDQLYEAIINGKKDAKFVKIDGKVEIEPDFPEVSLNKADFKKAFQSDSEIIKIKVTSKPAKVTKKELEEKLFKDKMGTWTSYFSGSNVPRSSNVRLTAERINETVLMPGEVFSYDKAIGKRTSENGYKVAGVYIGNKVEQGIGGGICQTSSTLYSAVLYANLEIVTRTSHSLPVSYMPGGQDATIAEGSIDFRFKNNTAYPIKIVATTTYGSVTCTILGVKPEGESVNISNTVTSILKPQTVKMINAEIPKGQKKTVQNGVDGFTTASVRTVYKDGEVIKRENLTKSVYRAQDIIIEVNPEDESTPPEELMEYDPDYKEEIVPETEMPESEIPESEIPEETENNTEENIQSEEVLTENIGEDVNEE